MIFVAQVDPTTNKIRQGLGFGNSAMSEAHIETHQGFIYVAVSGFVSPATHDYIDGQIVPKLKE